MIGWSSSPAWVMSCCLRRPLTVLPPRLWPSSMRNTLLLNAGASWAAYQIGAIEHLVTERGIEFDSYVGCGIGAMNAALLACGEYDVLIGFWDSISTRRLIRPNVTSPWRAMFRNSPQRAFVTAHVREQALIDRGANAGLHHVRSDDR